MPTPSVPFRMKRNPPPTITNTDQGPSVTATFWVAWSDADTFFDDCFGYRAPGANLTDPFSYGPWRWPVNPRLVCTACTITPMIPKNDPAAGGDLPLFGMAFGEYWKDAEAQVTFSVPQYEDAETQAQENQMQFDPANPITMCKQDMDFSVSYSQIPSNIFVWESDNKDIQFPVPVKIPEIEFNLEFPKLPFLPAKTILDYYDSVNSVAVLGCPVGTLLFGGCSTSQTFTNQGIREKKLKLKFTYRRVPWNEYLRPSATAVTQEKIKRKGVSPAKYVFEEKDHRKMFYTV